MGNSVVGGNSIVSGLGSILSAYTVRPGTNDYTSPEALKSGSYGPPMDIFSLGGVLFELLTLEVPPMVPLGEVDSRLPVRAVELLRGNSSRSRLIDGEPLETDSNERQALKDLGELCISMVSPSPQNRPTAKDIALKTGVRHHTVAIAAESEKLRVILDLPSSKIM